jgi:fructose transport system permease protein
VKQVAITFIIGAAQTLVILTAGIDLSVGAIMALSSVVMGAFILQYGIAVPIAIICSFCFGNLCDHAERSKIAAVNLGRFLTIYCGVSRKLEGVSAQRL